MADNTELVYVDGVKIGEVRAKLGLTMEQAGIAAGFDPKYAAQEWNRFEKSRYANPAVGKVHALAKALKRPIGLFILKVPIARERRR